MAEYIDREEYCEKHCRCSNEYCGKESCPIWKAPAADVVPVVHGRWIESKEHIYLTDSVCKEWINFYCSECDVPNNSPTDFCPSCGARMDGETEGNDG